MIDLRIGVVRCVRAEIGEQGCFGDLRQCGDGLELAWRPKDWERQMAGARTMYKRKDRKVNLVDVPLLGGVSPGGGVPGGDKIAGETAGGETVHDDVARHGGKRVPRESRLTPERLAEMKIGDGFLTAEERQLFIDVLFEFEGALVFTDSEMGLLHESIEPPVVVHTVPHSPWQQQNLRLLKLMQGAALAIIKEKLENGMLEYSQGPYRSRYFLVAKKKPGEWRLINDVQPMNRVTIRDAGMPPAIDEFSEDFAGSPIASSIDFYSFYYQILLAMDSRDLTAFLSPVGLVWMMRLPTGWTNLVAVSQRVMTKSSGHLRSMRGLSLTMWECGGHGHSIMMRKSAWEFVGLLRNMLQSSVGCWRRYGGLD